MIFLDLFWTFCKIGILSFGGGYAMIPLIQDEVVQQHQWLSVSEFTDLIALSQMTPGPIGINVATFVGYTSAVQAGYPTALAIVASLIASLSVLLLPFCLMLLLARLFIKHQNSQILAQSLKILRPVVLGLIASATFMLMTKENFGSYSDNMLIFIVNIMLALSALIAVYHYKVNPLKVLASAATFGLVFYPIVL